MADLLGAPPLGTAVFDKWWELERFEIDETCDEVEKQLPSDDLKLLQSDRRLVQAWRAERSREKL